MKHITFLGAAGTVTGSCYFLKEATKQGIIIDMGMFQGGRDLDALNYESIPLHPQDIQAIFLTHAHLDHSGRLPLLRKFGFSGNVYMTEATRALIELTLLDAVNVSREHNRGVELYSNEDVAWILRQAVIVEYGKPVTVGSFTVLYRDAGHILGSAFLEISFATNQDGIKRIVFSGDIGNYPEELVKPTEFASQADVVVMESTYGDRLHTEEKSIDVLMEEIQAIELSGGTLLIPAFSIERTQELLHLIDHLKKEQKVKNETRVFLDTTLGIKVTHVYQQYKALYNKEVSAHARIDDPFEFPGLTMIANTHESHDLDEMSGAKVIIAGSGMMNGGRILRHARFYLPHETTRILFVGFQAERSLGRAILEGAREVHIEGFTVPVRAHVRKSSGLSSHADQGKLINWLNAINGVSSVVLTHGEDLQRRILSEKITQMWPHVPVYLPQRNDTLTFGSDKKPFVRFGSSGWNNPKKKRV